MPEADNLEDRDTHSLDVLRYDTDARTVRFTLDEQLYPRDAIYGAAYLFIDRCFIYLSRPADQQVEVRLRSRGSGQDLDTLAGEFANELLNQVLRFRIGESTGPIREYIMARAFQAPQTSTIDQLLAELDAEEMEDDDLEIQVPWEQAVGGEE